MKANWASTQRTDGIRMVKPRVCFILATHTKFSRPLSSRFEGWLDGEHLVCEQEKEAQNHPQPDEDEPKIAADGTQPARPLNSSGRDDLVPSYVRSPPRSRSGV